MNYLGIDIGGTKTLAASFDHDGEVQAEVKLKTEHDYAAFMKGVARAIVELKATGIQAAGVAIPGLVDRQKGTVLSRGDMPWRNQPIATDISKLINNAPVKIENDANLAGLYEARLVPAHRRVLYLTVSTGVGGGVIFDGDILPELQDSEFGQMLFAFNGKPTRWEDFASGRAIVERYGVYASEITDESTWTAIAEDLGWGLSAAAAILQLEAVIFGGGVGAHFERFKQPLADFLDKNLHEIVTRPVLLPAQDAERSVLMGSYILAANG